MNLNQDTKPEKSFYCADGAVLKNLRELAGKLKTIGAEAYNHHANECKNDFRNWIRDVYGNKRLAEKVAAAKGSEDAARIIEKAIAPKAKRKKKPAKRENTVAVKKKPARRRRKPAKQMKKAASSAVASKKKGKKKPAGKIRKRKKPKRKPARRKIRLHRVVHNHLKKIARQFGFL